jgi:YggT family protein
MNISPFINLLGSVIHLYTMGLFIWLIIGFLIRFNVVNSYNKFVQQIMSFGNSLYESVLSKIRRVIPPISGIDLSPLLLLLLLELTKGLLYSIQL